MINKILYLLIALPLFVFGPLSLLICTECIYSDEINSLIPFGFGVILYYVIVIVPLNILFKKK